MWGPSTPLNSTATRSIVTVVAGSGTDTMGSGPVAGGRKSAPGAFPERVAVGPCLEQQRMKRILQSHWLRLLVYGALIYAAVDPSWSSPSGSRSAGCPLANVHPCGWCIPAGLIRDPGRPAPREFRAGNVLPARALLVPAGDHADRDVRAQGLPLQAGTAGQFRASCG